MSDVPSAHDEPEWVWGIRQFARWMLPVRFTPGYLISVALSCGLLLFCLLLMSVLWLMAKVERRKRT